MGCGGVGGMGWDGVGWGGVGWGGVGWDGVGWGGVGWGGDGGRANITRLPTTSCDPHPHPQLGIQINYINFIQAPLS